MIKSLWASIQGDPVFMRRVNGWLTVLCIALIPVSIATGWVSKVEYVAALSIWALVASHWSGWQSARVEVAQSNEAKERQRHPVEQKVVEQMVKDSRIRTGEK